MQFLSSLLEFFLRLIFSEQFSTQTLHILPLLDRHLFLSTVGLMKRLILLIKLVNAPMGQKLKHHLLKSVNSKTSIRGKINNPHDNLNEPKRYKTAKTNPKNKPIGQIKQNTGKLKINAVIKLMPKIIKGAAVLEVRLFFCLLSLAVDLPNITVGQIQAQKKRPAIIMVTNVVIKAATNFQVITPVAKIVCRSPSGHINSTPNTERAQ